MRYDMEATQINKLAESYTHRSGRKGLAKPVGSMTQYDKMRVGRGENKKYLHYGEIVPLATLDDIVFG